MKRKWTILALVVGMVGALLATAGVASGVPGDPVYVPRGWLLLDTTDNTSFSVTWHDFAGTEEDPELGPVLGTQTFRVDNKCNLKPPTGDNLIAITPTGLGATGVGALSHGLGVKTKNNCSTEQGQIALGQTLKIALGSAFDDTEFIKYAEVDVEGKRNAKLGVTYSSDDERKTITLTLSSDNGPDSGPGDNNIANLGTDVPPFRTVTFQPIANGSNGPAVSIEGGGDGTVTGGTLRPALGTNASVFEIVQEFDGLLDCEGTATAGGAEGDPRIEVRRAGVIEGCVLKPYNIDYSAADSEASFEPTGPVAEFTALIVWPEEWAPDTSVPETRLVPETFIDFDGPDGDPPEPVQWCSGDPIRAPSIPSSGFPSSGFLAIAETGAFSDPPGLPADGAPWCLLDQEVTYAGDGMIQVAEYYFGTGDPAFSR